MISTVLGHNVVYIVAGVVIEDGKVLMVQEAKPSCRGQWCLPAGTVDKKESLVVRSSLLYANFSMNVCAYIHSYIYMIHNYSCKHLYVLCFNWENFVLMIEGS